jgi:hypothetical protein
MADKVAVQIQELAKIVKQSSALINPNQCYPCSSVVRFWLFSRRRLGGLGAWLRFFHAIDGAFFHRR